MKLKKVLIINLAALFAAVAMTGCSKDTENEKKIGYISNINIEEKSFDFDEIEWITPEDTEKVEELGLDPQYDFPNGFYINNSATDKESYTISDKCTFEFIDWKDDFKAKSVTFEEFTNQHNEFYAVFYEPLGEASSTPYWIEIEDNKVVSIQQQYTP